MGARSALGPSGLRRVLRALGVVALAVGIPTVGVSSTAAQRVRPEVPVTPMNIGVGPANNSPQIVDDPTNSRFVVMANRLDAPDFSCALHVSTDGGQAWITANPVPKLPKGVEKCYAPEVAFDGQGRLYYLFVGLQGRGNEPIGAFVTTSVDYGQNFSKPKKVLGPLNFGVRMAIDPSKGPKGRMHLAWLHATSDTPLGGFGPPPNPVMTAHSDDGGTTFSRPVQVSDPARRYVVAPALALGPDQAVHVGYYDLQQDARDYLGLEGPTWQKTWSLVVSSSRDGGDRFGRGIVVDDRIKPSERVMLIFTMPPASLVADQKRLCAAWTDARHGDADAFARCSSDKGGSWGKLSRLNDDAVRNGRSQYLPRLSLSPDGRLDAVFLDRRRDPTNILYDVYYTYSSDAGREFAPNVRLTRYSSSSRIGQQYVGRSATGKFEFGSRLGLLSRSSSVLVAWPDTHNSNPLTRAQDIFATEVTSLPDPGAISVTTIAIGLLLLAALVAIAAAWWRAKGRRRQPVLHERG